VVGSLIAFHYTLALEYDGERIFKIDQHFAKLWAIISSFLLQNIVCKNIHSLKRNHHSSTAHAERLANVSYNLKFLKVDLHCEQKGFTVQVKKEKKHYSCKFNARLIRDDDLTQNVTLPWTSLNLSSIATTVGSVQILQLILTISSNHRNCV